MKIIAGDNLARDIVSDVLVCSDVNEYYGSRIVEMLNDEQGALAPWYYRLVPDDHVLYKWQP